MDGLYRKLNFRKKQTDFLVLLLCLPPSTLELPFYSPNLLLTFRIAPIIAALSSNTHSSGRSPFNPSTQLVFYYSTGPKSRELLDGIPFYRNKLFGEAVTLAKLY